MDCGGRRVAEHRQPVIYLFAREDFVGAGPFMSSPSSFLEVVMGLEELEKTARYSLLNIEKWTQRCVESLYCTRCSIPMLEDVVYIVEHDVCFFACCVVQHRQETEEVLFVPAAIPWTDMTFQVVGHSLDEAGKAHRAVTMTLGEGLQVFSQLCHVERKSGGSIVEVLAHSHAVRVGDLNHLPGRCLYPLLHLFGGEDVSCIQLNEGHCFYGFPRRDFVRIVNPQHLGTVSLGLLQVTVTLLQIPSTALLNLRKLLPRFVQLRNRP